MEKEFRKNTETFLREIRMSPPPLDSFETIHNMMDTIKEYREFNQSHSPSWNKYILDVFHILGFSTKNETKRIISLSEMGSTKSRRAIVMLVKQDENFREIVPELEWTTFLFFTAHFFRVDWGILTDGLIFKIFNRNYNFNKIYLQGNLDKMVREENFDDFFAYCNIISLIRGKPFKTVGQPAIKRKKHTGRYDLNYHLTNKSNTVLTILDVLRSKIKSLSDQIEERFNRMYIGYYANKSFCQIQPQRDQLKIWISLDFHQILDPPSFCRDVRKIGHHGMGNTELVINSFN